jgi:imidazoleglycerol-phosphate dehydratase
VSSQFGTVVASGDRSATIARETRETKITVALRLDGAGDTSVETGVGFFDHLLSAMAHHALFDLTVTATGDLDVDEHHTVEDVALVFGAALAQALGDRAGIVRFGDAAVPMDESVATAVVDVGGRPYAVVDVPFRGKRAGKLPLQLIEHVFESIARTGGLTLNVKARGRNDHHLAEAAFKAFGRALREATEIDPRRAGAPASTKGVLG